MQIRTTYLYIQLIQAIVFFISILGKEYCCASSRPTCFSMPEAGFGASPGIGVWSVFNNPAGTVSLDVFTFGAALESSGIDDGPVRRSACLAFPFQTGTVALGYCDYGTSVFKSRRIALALGKCFGDKTDIGICLSYISEDFSEYEGAGDATFSAGLNRKLSKHVVFSLHAGNLFNYLTAGKQNITVNSSFSAGISWMLTKDLSLLFDWRNYDNRVNDFCAGCTFRFSNMLMAGLAVRSDPVLISFGLNFRISGISLGASASMHSYLGTAPSCSMTYIRNK